MHNERFLNGKTAWITGASRGIGRAIATALARAGAEVCMGARSIEDLAQAASVINAEGNKAHAISLDVSDKNSVAEFARAAVEKCGPVDILVNNAGLGIFKDFDQMDIETFERQITVGLMGPWYMAHHAVPHMKNSGAGAVINISSIAGRVPFRRGTGYNAAKAGLNAMSEAMMLELRDYGIRVVTIAPGSVETGFHRTALPQAHVKDNSWMLEPESIAEACLHVLRLPENALVNYYEIRPLKPAK